MPETFYIRTKNESAKVVDLGTYIQILQGADEIILYKSDKAIADLIEVLSNIKNKK